MIFQISITRVRMGHGGRPWVADFNHPHYVAGRKAAKAGSYVYLLFAAVIFMKCCFLEVTELGDLPNIYYLDLFAVLFANLCQFLICHKKA